MPQIIFIAAALIFVLSYFVGWKLKTQNEREKFERRNSSGILEFENFAESQRFNRRQGFRNFVANILSYVALFSGMAIMFASIIWWSSSNHPI